MTSDQTVPESLATPPAAERAIARIRRARWLDKLTVLAIFAPVVTEMEIWRSGQITGEGLVLGLRQYAEIAAVLAQAALVALIMFAARPWPIVAWRAIRPYLLALTVVVVLHFSYFSFFSAIGFLASVFLIHFYLGDRNSNIYTRSAHLFIIWISIYYADAISMFLTHKTYYQSYLKTNIHTVAIAAISLFYVIRSKKLSTILTLIFVTIFACAMAESLTMTFAYIFIITIIITNRNSSLNILYISMIWIIFILVFLASGFVLFNTYFLSLISDLTNRPAAEIVTFTGRTELWASIFHSFLSSPISVMTGLGYAVAERIDVVQYFSELRDLQSQAGVPSDFLVPLYQHAHNFFLSAVLNGGLIWLAALTWPILVAAQHLGTHWSGSAADRASAALLVLFLFYAMTSAGYAGGFSLPYLLVGIPLHRALVSRRQSAGPLAAPAPQFRTR